MLLWFMLLGSAVYGQRAAVTGTVMDPQGEPLKGALISVKGGKGSVATDAQGRFSIDAAPSETVVISATGTEPQEIVASELASRPTIFMVDDANAIDEVVVVGYGAQKKASVVAAISTTKSEDLLQGGPVNSVSEALQGRITGLTAINSSSKPGDNTASMFIRGKSSWTNTDPLVLVDGMERNFNDVDMSEIESVSVLKDASATAVYGVRGGNGVILLTTKRGSGQKAKVVFNASLGFKKPTTKIEWPDFVTSANVWNEAAANDKSWGAMIPESTIAAWRNAYATGNYGPYNDVFPQVDWYDAVMKDFGTTQRYNVSVDGGNDRVSYFVSLSYYNDGDIYKLKKQPDFDPRTRYQRYNWRSNVDFKVTKSLKLSINIAGNAGYRGEKIGGDAGTYDKIIQAPLNTFPVKYSDGYWGDAMTGAWNVLANMYGQGEMVRRRSQNWYDFILRQDLSMVTKGLSVTGKVSYNSSINTSTTKRAAAVLGENDYNAGLWSVIRYAREYDYANPTIDQNGNITYPLKTNQRLPNSNAMEDMPVNASYDAYEHSGDRQFYEFNVNYGRKFGDHDVTALLLVNRTVTKDNPKDNTQFPEYREDWVGRGTYSYKERYLTEFNGSYTGSEKFAPGKRFKFFGSFSLGWRISEEPWMKKNVKQISNLKVRYSYGTVGSDRGAGRFQYIQLFNQVAGVTYGDGTGVGTGYRYTEGDIANPNSTWEFSKKQNLGLELGLWKNHLSLNVDVFDEKRSGILMAPRSIAAWSGLTPSSANLGRSKNHGIEAELFWRDQIGRNWSYNVGFSFSASENRIVDRGDPAGFYDYQKDAGKPIDWQRRYIVVGNYGTIDDVYNAATSNLNNINVIIPGDFAYIDYNGDGIIDSQDLVISDKLSYPLTTYALNLGLRYKSLSFSAMFYAPVGAYKVEWPQLYFDFPVGNVKAQPSSADRWTWDTANDSGIKTPATHLNTGRKHNDTDNTFRYKDYSYLRLKTAEIRYSLPKKWLNSINISNCEIYANGNNLWTYTKVDKRIDPETGGVANYPIVKTYTIGIRLGF